MYVFFGGGGGMECGSSSVSGLNVPRVRFLRVKVVDDVKWD